MLTILANANRKLREGASNCTYFSSKTHVCEILKANCNDTVLICNWEMI